VIHWTKAHETATQLLCLGRSHDAVIQVLQELGACNELTWAYDEARINHRPLPDAYDEALNFLIEEAHEIEIDLDAMKHCLAEGYIPYDYLANPEYCDECWAIRAISDLDFSCDVWVEEDYSVWGALRNIFGNSLEEDEYEEDSEEEDLEEENEEDEEDEEDDELEEEEGDDEYEEEE
jgi:hypothetical protein